MAHSRKKNARRARPSSHRTSRQRSIRRRDRATRRRSRRGEEKRYGSAVTENPEEDAIADDWGPLTLFQKECFVVSFVREDDGREVVLDSFCSPRWARKGEKGKKPADQFVVIYLDGVRVCTISGDEFLIVAEHEHTPLNDRKLGDAIQDALRNGNNESLEDKLLRTPRGMERTNSHKEFFEGEIETGNREKPPTSRRPAFKKRNETPLQEGKEDGDGDDSFPSRYPV